jgi:hypothetical protein
MVGSPQLERALKAALATLAVGALLALMALANENLPRQTEVAPGVNWIYLPAGLRMCCALVPPLQGALAIFLATAAMASRDPELNALLTLANAAVTTTGPTLARIVALQRRGLQPDLSNLKSGMLWLLAALFGLFRTTLHHAFYASSIGRDSAFFSMWVGDTLGCLLCLYGLKGMATLWHRT